MRFLTLFLILIVVIPVSAQDKYEPTEWDIFRFTESNKQVADGLGDVQQLLGGRESILQSYERTQQSQIATERAAEGLYRDRIATKSTSLAYFEALINFQYPDEEYEMPINEADELKRMREQVERDVELEKYRRSLLSQQTPPEPIPPRIRIRSLTETDDGVLMQIENLGDPINALVSVADASSAIISNPYHVELRNWDDPRWISFDLPNSETKINLLVQPATGKSYKLPLFIRICPRHQLASLFRLHSASAKKAKR